MSQLHDALKPLGWLIGRWRTFEASVFYPSMKTMEYVEEMDFLPLGNLPVLSHKTKTWDPVTKKEMHTETGTLRAHTESNQVALFVTHIFGSTEISEGRIDHEKELTLSSTSTGNVSFIKVSGLQKVQRHYKLENDVLVSEFSIGTVNHPLQPHVIAKYRKIEE